MAIKETQSTGGYKPFTGLEVCDVLAFNPSNEEYKKLTGREISYELSYTKDDNGRKRNAFLVKSRKTGSFYFADFYISDKPRSNKEETKFEFVDKNLNFSWSNLDGGFADTSGTFDAASAKKAGDGLSDFIAFLKTVSESKPRTDDFMINIKEEDINADKLLKADKTEVNKFLLKCAVKPSTGTASIALFFTCYTNLTTGKMRQRIQTKSNYFFIASANKQGEINVTPYMKERLQKTLDETASKGYPMKDMYSIDFDYISEPVIEESSSNDSDDLPF